MSGHTPGPWPFIAREWQLGPKHSDWVVSDGGHNWICLGPSWDAEFARESEANARLIAAAPDSHEANVAMVDALNVAFNIQPGFDDDRIYDELPSSAVANAYFKARAAIARATGADK